MVLLLPLYSSNNNTVMYFHPGLRPTLGWSQCFLSPERQFVVSLQKHHTGSMKLVMERTYFHKMENGKIQ